MPVLKKTCLLMKEGKMITKYYDLTKCIDDEKLKEASQIILGGGLVAIPTETVYGLAANALDPVALKKIFIAKNRPQDNPLILHISKIEDIYKLACDINDENVKILEELWPGPLTVVFKKKNIVPREVSAGLDTVAIRIPEKKLTRRFIDMCGVPLAAPSANLSTKPSPTNAPDVLQDMEGRIDAVIDGGDSKIGLESTVLDLSGDHPTILRPGYYTKEYLQRYWKNIEFDLALRKEGEIPKSPGQKYKHYAPKAEVLVLVGENDKVKARICEIVKKSDKKLGIMTFEENRFDYGIEDVVYMGSSNNYETMAHVLFRCLRDMDKKGVEYIIVQGVKDEGFGLSIMNRLKKSASGNIEFI